MISNKKGETLGLTIVSILLVFLIGMVLINFLTPEIDLARANLSCASPADISDGTKVLCLIIDTTVPYWIWLIFSIVIGAIVGRFLS